jgi:hypothetical protein
LDKHLIQRREQYHRPLIRDGLRFSAASSSRMVRSSGKLYEQVFQVFFECREWGALFRPREIWCRANCRFVSIRCRLFSVISAALLGQ